MRLIDADAAIDALNQLRETTYATDYGIVDCDDAISAIATLPTIHPQTGKWIYQMGMIKCSQCLRAIRRIDHDGLLNFCPNCGARMVTE